jgi:predicted enzyme related to lactoylglutathione lyase
VFIVLLINIKIKALEAPDHPTFGNGKICYMEIPSRDIHESSNFYKRVFGWEIRTNSEGKLSFDDAVNEVSGTWRIDRIPNAGIGILIYIMVDDIQSTIKKVLDHGGEIVQPVGMEAPEITARFKDPTGNILGIFQQ